MSNRLLKKGYGTGWSEPLATGKWARFKQRMREPATKDDVILGFALMPMIIIASFIVILSILD